MSRQGAESGSAFCRLIQREDDFLQGFQSAFRCSTGSDFVLVGFARPSEICGRWAPGVEARELCGWAESLFARGIGALIRSNDSIWLIRTHERSRLLIPLAVGDGALGVICAQDQCAGTDHRSFRVAQGKAIPGCSVHYCPRAGTPERRTAFSTKLLVNLAIQLEARARPVSRLVHSPAVIRAICYINERISESISPAEALRQANMSRSHFYRLFRKETGITMSAYIARERLRRAKDMLRHSALTITEVALNAGFGSISRFNHLFKLHTGVTPSAYRCSLRGSVAARESAASHGTPRAAVPVGLW